MVKLSFRRIVVRRFAPVVLICATVFGAPAALQISSTPAAAGGFAQIAIYAVKPMAISSGHLVLSLDPTAFGAGAMVGLFGANGDASGLAATTGEQIDVQFSSPSGGIGQLAGLPVMVVSVPVLAGAAGRTVTVSATSPDPSVTVGSGSLTVQGTLSVGKIPAGMGVVPAGTVVPVTGTGFTSSTTVSIDGVVISSTEFVSATEIDVTIGGSTELVGKLARVTDSGVEFDYFCFQPNDPVNFSAGGSVGAYLSNTQPMFPLAAAGGYSAHVASVGGVVEIENPNPTVAVVSFANLNQYGSGTAATPVSIPAGSWTAFTTADEGASWVTTSTLPIRVLPLGFCGDGIGPPVCVLPLNIAPYDEATQDPPPALTPPSLAFAWQMGSPVLPAPRSIYVNTSASGTLTFTVTSGSSWLSYAKGGVTVNPSQLSLGTYQGSISITQDALSFATLPVTLTVTSTSVPQILTNPASIAFTVPSTTATPYSQTIAVASDSGPTPFLVVPAYGTFLKVSPVSGVTPATLTVTWDPTLTSQFGYTQSSTASSIMISGLANTVTIPATFNVTGVLAYPSALVFSTPQSSIPQPQTINVGPVGPTTAAVNQPWMTATPVTLANDPYQEVTVTVNPKGLAAGVYTGAVTIGEAGVTPFAVPVTLAVYTTPPPVTITTSSFTFVEAAGEPAPPYQTAEVNSGGVPVPLTITAGASWLNVIGGGLTPAAITVGVTNQSLGEYQGSFTVQSPGGSVDVPVTLLVEPGPVTPPVVASVVNAASGIPGAVSPGEIASVRGYGVGAAAVSSAIGTNLNGLQVTFDGRPATLFYTSANQTNLVVPQGVSKSTLMQVTSNAGQSAAWVLPVVGVTPGIFTVDGTGTGQGAIVNQDGTVNSAANPAARGSIVSIYMTGQGGASPALTGILPTNVAVMIGGIATMVQYAGQAPGEIAGLTQVNAVVPQGVEVGPMVPVAVGVGAVQSQAGVTVAVK
jgi:uncharacterized protein (TIGR03437 family)